MNKANKPEASSKLETALQNAIEHAAKSNVDVVMTFKPEKGETLQFKINADSTVEGLLKAARQKPNGIGNNARSITSPEASIKHAK